MILLGNGYLITRDSNNPFIENGCVAMDKGLVVEVGKLADLRSKYPDAEYIDAKGKVIMPGMINAHNHIYSAFARGLNIIGPARRTFLEILDGQWWTIDRHLLLECTKMSAECTFIDCIENGVTTIFDHHASYGDIKDSLFKIGDAAKQYGVRANLCYEISDRDGEDKMKEAVRENVEFIKYSRQDTSDMISGIMGMHAPFTLSDKSLEYCVSLNPEDAGYHIHVAEGILDVQESLSKHGKRPVFRLHDFGILGCQTILGHCTHVSEAEMNLIADTDSMVAHNPESNMGNAIGCPPVIRMFSKGILIGLGTDGYTNDMIESYKVGNILHKHELCDPTVAWGEIPTMLFENNAKMAGRVFDKPVGILKEGAHADVVVMDYIPLTPMTKDNYNSHILFGMNGRNTVTTIVGGEVKMLNRELVGVDKEAVFAHAREVASDMWTRINSR